MLRTNWIATGLLLSTATMAVAQDEGAAQDEFTRLYESIRWETGPTTVSIGENAQIKVPEGFQFTHHEGAQIWNRLTQNPPDNTQGLLMPSGQESWAVFFEFDPIGYVKDDEKDELDGDAILEAMQQGTEASNEYRRSQGWSGIHIDGWIVAPKYDEATNNLVWATRLRSDDGMMNANHSTRLLGRHGVMNVVLVCDVEEMPSVIPQVNSLLKGFEFKDGHKYGEWRAGDKVAQYGLTGLITGGAAVAAAKTGLLGKLAMVFAKAGKAVVVFIALIAGGIWKFITGRSRAEA